MPDDIRLLLPSTVAAFVWARRMDDVVGPCIGCGARWLMALLSVGALAFCLAFYRHTVRVVFNREPTYSWASLTAYLRLTRPLETMWRLATYRLRVAPDLVLVGEVRCGTTSLATHLSRLPGARPPFSPWKVPFADAKESFFLVGHWLGVVHPQVYRAVFPTVFEKYLARLLGRPFFAYDACAQYLTAPWAASQLRLLSPEVRVIACVREPSAQNASWWRFEQASMAWARDLRLGDDWLPVRGAYPPDTLRTAVEESRGEALGRLYDRAERLGLRQAAGAAPVPLAIWRLPEWASTWPGGQLAAFWHCGNYARNLRRYFAHFRRDQVLVVELSELSERRLRATLGRITALLAPALGRAFKRAVGARPPATEEVRSNASARLPEQLEPSRADMAAIKDLYGVSNAELFELLGDAYHGARW